MDKAKHIDETEETANETTACDSAEPEKQGETPTEASAAPDDPCEKLKAELSQMQDKYLRMLAEYDNYRRRSAKEKEGTYSAAVADTVEKLLPIADDLDLAAAAIGDPEAMRKGLEMTNHALSDLLTALNVEKFGEVGEPFDPNLHNAVMHTDDPALGENQIAEVFRCGYKRGDRVIRCAMVKVAN